MEGRQHNPILLGQELGWVWKRRWCLSLLQTSAPKKPFSFYFEGCSWKEYRPLMQFCVTPVYHQYSLRYIKCNQCTRARKCNTAEKNCSNNSQVYKIVSKSCVYIKSLSSGLLWSFKQGNTLKKKENPYFRATTICTILSLEL